MLTLSILIHQLSFVPYTVNLALDILIGLSYTVVLHARYGQTFGKWAVGIQLKTVSLEKVGLRHALARSSVDILLSVIGFGGILYAASRADQALLDSLAVAQRGIFLGLEANERFAELHKQLTALDPTHGVVTNIGAIGVWSEVITVLFNRKRRALHDFIAGTVVVIKIPTPKE